MFVTFFSVPLLPLIPQCPSFYSCRKPVGVASSDVVSNLASGPERKTEWLIFPRSSQPCGLFYVEVSPWSLMTYRVVHGRTKRVDLTVSPCIPVPWIPVVTLLVKADLGMRHIKGFKHMSVSSEAFVCFLNQNWVKLVPISSAVGQTVMTGEGAENSKCPRVSWEAWPHSSFQL